MTITNCQQSIGIGVSVNGIHCPALFFPNGILIWILFKIRGNMIHFYCWECRLNLSSQYRHFRLLRIWQFKLSKWIMMSFDFSPKKSVELILWSSKVWEQIKFGEQWGRDAYFGNKGLKFWNNRRFRLQHCLMCAMSSCPFYFLRWLLTTLIPLQWLQCLWLMYTKHFFY